MDRLRTLALAPMGGEAAGGAGADAETAGSALLGGGAEEGVFTAWSPAPAAPVRWTTPRFLRRLAAGCCATAALVALAGLLSQSREHSIVGGGMEAEVEAKWAGAKPWLLCSSSAACNSPQLLPWRVPPASLAGQVPPYLESLPGVNANTYRAVAEKWSATPPSFRGAPVPLTTVAGFMKDLLTCDPFATGNSVPYVDMQGEPGKIVAVTQRQLAFVVANVLMGNSIPVGDGLSEALNRCTGRGHSTVIYSLLSFLAVLSQELVAGSHGPFLIASTPGADEKQYLNRLKTASMGAPNICKEVGTGGTGASCGLADFMSGGTPHQSMTDIAGSVVGGGSELCGLANTQDESLVQFYSEVLAFAFFVSSGHPKMLPVPWVLLGARVYLKGISGESGGPGGAQCGHLEESDWINDAINTQSVQVALNGEQVWVQAEAFVAVASKSSSAFNTCANHEYVNNNCDSQRRHLQDDVAFWYRAFEPTMYPPQVQQAVSSIIRRIGTGPWGAGDWFGDSQQYFLAVWLATSILSNTPVLDYYVYDHFCENPGNQCFVLGQSACAACIESSGVGQVDAGRCGTASIEDTVSVFQGRPALALYNALRNVGPPPGQVFDHMQTVAGNLMNMLQSPGDAPPPRGWAQPGQSAPPGGAAAAGAGAAGVLPPPESSMADERAGAAAGGALLPAAPTPVKLIADVVGGEAEGRPVAVKLIALVVGVVAVALLGWAAMEQFSRSAAAETYPPRSYARPVGVHETMVRSPSGGMVLSQPPPVQYRR